jgi:hypothetical protein
VEPGPDSVPPTPASAWDPAVDIDWHVAPRRPHWLPRRNHIVLASQFLQGEAIALAACQRLAAVLEPAAAAALAHQADDEARHACAYQLYLARLGDAAPAAGSLDAALDALIARPASPVALLLATHVLLEGEALAVQAEIARWFDCPLLGQITRRVMRDEARHIALGPALLGPAIARLDREKRAALYRSLRRQWRDCARAAARDHGGGVFARVTPSGALDRRWARRRQVLVRVGLVDDRHPAFAD